MKEYKVWIYDDESGCCQPMKCKAKSETEAKRLGRQYIRQWNLQGGTIEKVEEVKDETVCVR